MRVKIAVLVSGGVDSSVALRLLKDQGHDVTAFYLKIWLEDELSFLGECPWDDDLDYVRRVCKQADVPLEVVSMQKEYWDHVVSYTIDEIKAGRTPNPDVMCNKQIKFGFFLDKIDASYEKVASGHYAQLITQNGDTQLVRAPDDVKDQTYFLCQLSEKQRKRLLFPIGHLSKEEVRTLAHEYDLPNKDRKDSQGICFLGKLKFNEFINHYLGQVPGDMIEFETGKILGQHKGFWYHTIGQRQGSGLSGGPWYVVDKDPAQNIVYFSRNYYSEDKKRNSFGLTSCNWMIKDIPVDQKLSVKLRHGKKMHECVIGRDENERLQVTLAERDQGIAAGQFAVFYDGATCLGGGVISFAQR